MKNGIVVRSEIFREDDLYVAICPDLDVSSYGETENEARISLKEAVEAFLEECEKMGTLEEVLEEAGFTRSAHQWLPRQPILAELVALG